jgi:hypothetical protein
MSATRDKSQKVAFVYSNLYQLYRKGRDAAVGADPQAVIAKYKAQQPAAGSEMAPGTQGLSSGRVIKADDLRAASANGGAPAKPEFEPAVAVRHYEPAALIGKRLPKPEAITSAAGAHPIQNQALNSLKQNLNALQDLHARLRFMLQELEELVKE